MPDEPKDPLADLQTVVEAEFEKLQTESEANSAYDLAERLYTKICFSRTRAQIRDFAADLMKLCSEADGKKFAVLAPLVAAIRARLRPVILIPVLPERETPTDAVPALLQEFQRELGLWPESIAQGTVFHMLTDFGPSLFDADFFARDYIKWIYKYEGFCELLTSFRHVVDAQQKQELRLWLHRLRRTFFRLNALLHKEAGAK
ncbi:hypothetical protein HZA87_01000 [Candidatus Uhrbacteria bacterium]|nr:hypothetical protein [Candidatus Uhrbacteria bacterium]